MLLNSHQKENQNVIWRPHPGKQREALTRSEFEVLYGGARGGGKTDAGIAWLLKASHHPKFRGLVLRRNSDDLRDWVDRAEQLYSQLANPAVRSGNPPEFKFKSGAIIRTGHLKDETAYTKYQGHEYQRIVIEELTQIPDEKRYLKLLASCRSTVDDLDARIFCTTNPGEVGHMWVKKRFIDVGEWGKTYWFSMDLPNGQKLERSRVFIHATMDDNPTLITKDPGYVATIEQLKDVDYETYMAWRFGDWDRFAGQVFKEFGRDRHVINRLIPKNEYLHYLWMDWGYSEKSAFAAYLSAVIPKTTTEGDKYNRVITYKEFYGNQKEPGEWARIIYKFCQENDIHPKKGYTDPAMHNPETSGSTDIATVMEHKWRDLHGDNWLKLEKGINTRTGRVGRVALVHNWLSLGPGKVPYWLITENCIKLIETLPMLVYDENNVEDVDTDQEDHSYDSSGYGLSRVKFISVKAGGYDTHETKKPLDVFKLDLDQFKKPGNEETWKSL